MVRALAFELKYLLFSKLALVMRKLNGGVHVLCDVCLWSLLALPYTNHLNRKLSSFHLSVDSSRDVAKKTLSWLIYKPSCFF